MKRNIRALVAFALALTMSLGLSLDASALAPEEYAGEYGGFIVKLRAQDPQEASVMALEAEVPLTPVMPELNYYRANSKEELADLVHSGRVEFIEPDYKAELFEAPNDPGYKDGKQYNLDRIGLDYAWNNKLTGEGVKVGVVDSGYAVGHPDLPIHMEGGMYSYYVEDPKGTVVLGDDKKTYTMVNLQKGNPNFEEKTDMQDQTGKSGHGSLTISVIAACTNNGIGGAGIAPNVTIIPARGFSQTAGHISGYASNLIQGVNYVVDQGAQVVNMSWGVYGNLSALRDCMERAAEKGVILVASVGNDGDKPESDKHPPGSLVYPAAYDNVIGVGAVGEDGNVASYSQRNQIALVVAPGDSIYGMDKDGGYTTNKGTSFSAPTVAAVAALMKQKDPQLTNGECRALLAATAIPLTGNGAFNKFSGRGLINVEKLITRSGNPAGSAHSRGKPNPTAELTAFADFYLGPNTAAQAKTYQVLCGAYDKGGHLLFSKQETLSHLAGEDFVKVSYSVPTEKIPSVAAFRFFLLDPQNKFIAVMPKLECKASGA